MKLNFWQIIGLVLLVIGVAWYIWREMNERATTKPSTMIHVTTLA